MKGAKFAYKDTGRKTVKQMKNLPMAEQAHWEQIANIEWKSSQTFYKEKDIDYFCHVNNIEFQRQVNQNMAMRNTVDV